MAMHRRTLLGTLACFAAGTARAASLSNAFEPYEQTTGGHVGLFAVNVRSGATITHRAEQRFAMCSTFKMSLVACVLARIDRGEDRLDRIVPYGPSDILPYAPVAKANLAKGGLPVSELCRGAIELSDNTCANLLLARIGGPAALTAFWRATGDAVSRLDHNEPLLNRSRPGELADTTTPAAMAGNVRRFVLGNVLSAASRERLTGWMIACKTGGELLRAGLPHGWQVGDKTGNNGKDALGDIAVAWPAPARPIVICAYVQGGAPTTAQQHRLFAEIGRLVGQRLA